MIASLRLGECEWKVKTMTTRLLSNIDREILKAILSPDGKHSSTYFCQRNLEFLKLQFKEDAVV